MNSAKKRKLNFMYCECYFLINELIYFEELKKTIKPKVQFDGLIGDYLDLILRIFAISSATNCTLVPTTI